MGNRDVAEAWAYHDATKHSLASLRRDPHTLDWEIMPRPFKVYPDLEPIPLARDLTSSPRPALDAIADDGRNDDADAPLDVGVLAHLLYFTAGVLKRRTYPIGESFFRAAACTGNLHHIDAYLATADVTGLDAGLYHFSPHDFALRRLRAGDQRAALIEATAAEPHVADARAILILTTTYWRNAWKYRARAFRHAFWDGGTLLSNLLALASARGMRARLVLGFVDDAVNRLIGVDPQHEAAIALVAIGRGAEPPPPLPTPPAPLDLATLPLSIRTVEHPKIPAAYRSGVLASPADVVAWRDGALASAAGTDAAVNDATPDAIPLAAPTEGALQESIEQVILRRGSTRRFAQEPISFAALSTILRASSRGIAADFLMPNAQLADVYLIVNAVDDLAPGAYLFDRTRDALVLLREGSFRREAGYLGLGQQLPADAAVDLFWLTDLSRVLGALGNRGYRAAQLEAAVDGGKTYLAAYALHLGASGLTFFDDDVTTFFSPHARGKSVMFLMAVGVPQRLPRARGSR